MNGEAKNILETVTALYSKNLAFFTSDKGKSQRTKVETVSHKAEIKNGILLNTNMEKKIPPNYTELLKC